MKKFVVFLIVLLFGLLIFSCSKKTTDPEPIEDDPVGIITSADLALAESSNSFGFKIFNAVNTENLNDNLFISPLSISMALGMAYNGAAGDTREAIQNTLDLNGMTLDEVNSSYKNLIHFLTQLDPSVIFEIANSNWIRKGFPVKQEFIDLNREYFDAEVTELVFNDAAVDIINNWVSEKTHDKIESIIEPPINPLTVLFLINAIYFKGTWTYEFDPEYTEDMLFHLPDNTAFDHPLMMQKSEYLYYENENLQIIDLPYGDEQFSMTIFLPSPGANINDFVASFTKENWDTWIGNLSKDSVNLSMPKFKLEAEYTLNEVLKALGMEIAFSNAADFSNITEAANLAISNVKHKTFVEVNEEGTEAAAVTVIEFEITSLPPNEIFMTINRPFVFVIRDHETNSMLFMGKIIKPAV